MFRHQGAIGLLAATAILAACNDTPDAGPMSPQFQLSGLACRPATVQKLAKSFFGNGSAGLSFAQQLTTNQTTNVPIVFNIFVEIAKKADAGPLTALQKFDGANLNVQAIACAQVVGTDLSLTGLEDTVPFRKALEVTGAYEVRGRTGDPNADADVKSHNASSIDPSVSAGASGVRPPTGGFRNWQGDQVLFYGSPRDGFSSEAAPGTGRVAFEWFTVKPVNAATNGDLSGIVAICVNVPAAAPKLRVQHEQTILPITGFDLCPSTGSFLQRPQTTRPLRGLEWFARTFLAPAELQAATMLLTVSPGGTAKKFSPYEVVNPVSVQLAFEHQPADGRVNQTIPSADAGFPVTVSAKGAQGTAWEGVSVRIFGVNNNGLKVPFTNDLSVTDSTGMAVFNSIASPKTGGFNVFAVTVPATADPDVANFVPDTTTAAQRINIRP